LYRDLPTPPTLGAAPTGRRPIEVSAPRCIGLRTKPTVDVDPIIMSGKFRTDCGASASV
jgi:hypothetical protein